MPSGTGAGHLDPDPIRRAVGSEYLVTEIPDQEAPRRMDTTGRPGRPPRMSRDKIVATAIEILTQDGYAKLSMRYLAARLGTSPMGIYYYFESKNQLLGFLFSHHDGMVDFRRDSPAQEPFERAVAIAEAMVRYLEAHRWVFAGLLDGYIGVEDFTANHLADLVESVRDLGLDDDDAAETVRGIWRIVLGEALIRAAMPDMGIGAEADALGPLSTETVESYLAGRLARVHRRR
ncbi:hypothetical protein TPB0596_01060 [Tsukamurella pulmonis]|nr:hypothetical protein TPB0596_01060 [Tsukamurella pulmonis]